MELIPRYVTFTRLCCFKETRTRNHHACLQESVLSAFADRPIPESLGCLEHTGRTPGFEISSKLLDCSLNKSSSPGISNSLHFELLQRDVIDVRLNSGCTASGFLFQPIVSCDSSSPKQLQAVTVHLSLPESEGCRFLGVEDAPSGAECVAAYDVGGRVIFSRAQYADNVPCKVLYVGHETAGTASSCMVDSAKAEMELRAPSGRQIVKQLSGQLLACIEDEDKTSYSMRVSVEVTAVEVRPHSRMPLFSRQLSFRSKEPAEKVYVLDKEVQICS